MKKYALVMALALAASLAQADVAVYGKVRQYLNNDQVGTARGDGAGEMGDALPAVSLP